MAKNLVIVESPAKARTLNKYLGRDYQVKASVGHVVDLPKSKLGVDIEHDFKPEYQVIHGKGKLITELRQAAKGKENIYLAPDPDREGEAIAWHIAQKLDGKRSNIRRVLFNEITKRAVQEALKHPRDLDQNLFEAQQTRRILDRLVGYQISPLLWEKVRRGLSAGRVQSVAVRIVCDREREIQAFKAVEYWSITAALEAGTPPPFEARLFRIGDQKLDPDKFRLENEAAASDRVAALQKATWTVTKVEKKERRRFPAPPFITSRLQQEAARKLGYSPSRTMRIAQRLYEGIELGSEGPVGLITYMRTDSTRTAPEALQEVRQYIGERYGKPYLPNDAVMYRSKKGAQDAHEAIRPTVLDRPPESVAGVSLEGGAGSLHSHLEPLRGQPDDAGRVRPDLGRHHCRGCPLPRHRAGDEVRRLHPGLHRGARRGTRRGGRRPGANPSAAGGGRGAAPARAQAGATLHAAAGALQPGDADQGARGEGDRAPVDLRLDHVDDPVQGIRHRGPAAPAADRARLPGHRPAGAVLSRSCSTSSSPPGWKTSSTRSRRGGSRGWTP